VPNDEQHGSDAAAHDAAHRFFDEGFVEFGQDGEFICPAGGLFGAYLVGFWFSL
jgi:hypothetical protein